MGLVTKKQSKGTILKRVVYTVGYLFCGSGGGALGHDASTYQLDGTHYEWKSLGGIDFDPLCCKDFTNLTGAPSLCADIARMRPRELRAFFGAVAPTMFKWSPPCKGASQLTSKEKSLTQKYVDMNRLALKALRKVLAAWRRPEEMARQIVIENVPAFKSRCARYLKEMLRLLHRAGYTTDLRTHDLGAEGGLAQRRERFTISARLTARCPVPVGMPPPKRLRGVGEVLGPLPFPDDPRAGPMHVLPDIDFLNAVRLALIPPAGDWRNLPKRGQVVEWLKARGHWPTNVDTTEFRELVEREFSTPVKPGQKKREVFRRHPNQAWRDPAPTVSGPGGMGLFGVEDQRVRVEGIAHPAQEGVGIAKKNGLLGVNDWRKESPTVTSTSEVSRAQGAGAVADPRVLAAMEGQLAFDGLALGHEPRRGASGVTPWDEANGAVRGVSRHDNGGAAVADPRPLDALAMGADNDRRHTNKYANTDWDSASRTVTSAQQLGSGGPAVSDPRPLEQLGLGLTASNAGSFKGRPGLFGVLAEGQPASTISSTMGVSCSNTPAAVADSRLRERLDRLERLAVSEGCRNGFYGVLLWDDAAGTVTGSLQIDNGPAAVADKRRLPRGRMVISMALALQLLAEGWTPPKGMLMPAIISPLSGCWHRPMTTLELAALQGLPAFTDGKPLVLAGKSHKTWREHIGNMIPVGGAEAWGRVLLESLARSDRGDGWWMYPDGQWFRPERGEPVAYDVAFHAEDASTEELLLRLATLREQMGGGDAGAAGWLQ